MSILEGELVDLRLDVDPGDGWVLLECLSLDLVIEVADVADNSVVFHLAHVIDSDDLLVSSCSDVDIDNGQNVFDPHDFVSLHAGLKGADGIDLSHVDSRTTASHGLGASLSDVSEAADEDLLSRDHDISGPVDSVDKRVLASVDVVELGLGD